MFYFCKHIYELQLRHCIDSMICTLLYIYVFSSVSGRERYAGKVNVTLETGKIHVCDGFNVRESYL